MTTENKFSIDYAELVLANEWFRAVAAMSPDKEGISRPAYSSKETEVLEFLAEQARNAGLNVSYDAAQNAVFCLPKDADAEKYILVGSHVDTVPMGGNFDGLAGVLAGLLASRKSVQFALSSSCEGHRHAR